LARWPELAFCELNLIFTNEPILLPAAPHSERCEFPPQTDKYRGIVGEELFDRLGRPSFCDKAVAMVMERIAERMEQQGSANSKSTPCAFAPQEGWIRGLPRKKLSG